MKKLASLVAAVALFFAVAGVAMAQVPGGVLVVNHGDALQVTGSVAVSNSGLNAISAGQPWSVTKQTATITTGDAVSYAGTQAIANQFVTNVKVLDSTSIEGCFPKDGGPDFDNIKVINHGDAFQLTGSLALASSGLNAIRTGMGFVNQNAKITTGDAGSIAETTVWANIYNTKVTSVDSFTMTFPDFPERPIN